MIEFAIIFIIVWACAILRIVRHERSRKALLGLEKQELERCRMAYENETAAGGYGLDDRELTDEAKRYQAWLNRHEIDSDHDCITLCVGMIVSVMIYWLVFELKTADNVGWMIILMLFLVAAATVLGVVLGEGVSLILDKTLKADRKDARYWLTRLAGCLAAVALATVLFYFFKPEGYEY